MFRDFLTGLRITDRAMREPPLMADKPICRFLRTGEVNLLSRRVHRHRIAISTWIEAFTRRPMQFVPFFGVGRRALSHEVIVNVSDSGIVYLS